MIVNHVKFVNGNRSRLIATIGKTVVECEIESETDRNKM